jgi:hypothetical protein
MRSKSCFSVIFCLSILAYTVPLQAANKLWQAQSQVNQHANTERQALRAAANNARYLNIDDDVLAQMQTQIKQGHKLQLPLPDGQWLEFTLTPSPVLSAPLASKYPQLMTYKGEQLGRPTNYGRFSLSPQGFFGFYRVENDWFLLSPQLKDRSNDYMVYRYQDALDEISIERLKKTTNSDVLLIEPLSADADLQQKNASIGEQIRTYRLAISTSGEYGQKMGGTLADVVAESMILVNRINQILLSDLALQFELVDSEAVMFTDANSDPYTNTDAASDVDINQSTLDNLLGQANYDLGHLLTTNGGGLAGVGVVCRSNSKALGTSGASEPRGERFYIDLLAHELGHQLGARHSFNAQDQSNCDTGQRSAQSAFEPGSGSTIMSYAGLCSGQNLQVNSDPYFHAGSIAEIRSYVEGFSGSSCGSSAQQSNAIPQIQLASNTYTIPANTPFVIAASASDADNDALLYNWEQIDAGGDSGGTANGLAMASDNGANPLFRSYPATESSQRYFPQLSSVLNDQLLVGETYASTDRSLTLRISVKDNKGGLNSRDVSVNVVNNQQKFAITAPNSAQTWIGLSQQTLYWDVAGTNQSPYNCSAVDIFLSSQVSPNFDTELATSVANDGEHIITVPNIDSTAVRLMLKCSDKLFYALNSSNLTITKVEPIQPVITGQTALSMNEDSTISLSLENLRVEDADSIYPDDFSLSIQAGANYLITGSDITPAANFNGQLAVLISVDDGSLVSDFFSLQIQVNAINDAPKAQDDRVSLSQNATATLIDVLANDSDIDNNTLTITSFSYNGQGLVSITNQQISYQPANGFSGNESLSYTLSDGELSSTALLSITVNTQPNTSSPSSSGGGALTWSLLYLSCILLLTRRVIFNETSI